MLEIKCEGCGRRASSFEVVDYGSMDTGYKQLCRRGFNMKAATAAGLDDFEHVDFERVRLTDSGGKPHEFSFPHVYVWNGRRVGRLRTSRRQSGGLPVPGRRRA